MVAISIINSLAMIFIMILPGYIFRKRSIISVTQIGAVNSIVVNLTWPCLVIDAMQIKFSADTLKDAGYIVIVCFIAFAVIAVLGIPIVKHLKLNKSKQYLVLFMFLQGNTGFIGIPVIKALYGTNALFYAAIVEFAHDIFLFTIGVLLIQMSAGVSLKIRPLDLLSPGLVGVIIGIVLFIMDFRLPDVLGGSIEMIGNATTPLTMFSIGFQLGSIRLKEFFKEWQVYAVLFVKLMIVPAITVIILMILSEEIALLEKVIIILFAMPIASVASIFSQQYKGEVEFATKSVLLSTVMSLVTVPIFAILLEIWI